MRAIIKIKDRYYEWSTVTDAPVTPGMTLDELQAFIKEEYGRQGLEDMSDRLEKVERTGCSTGERLEDFIRLNRAGPRDLCYTADQIYELYQ